MSWDSACTKARLCILQAAAQRSRGDNSKRGVSRCIRRFHRMCGDFGTLGSRRFQLTWGVLSVGARRQISRLLQWLHQVGHSMRLGIKGGMVFPPPAWHHRLTWMQTLTWLWHFRCRRYAFLLYWFIKTLDDALSLDDSLCYPLCHVTACLCAAREAVGTATAAYYLTADSACGCCLLTRCCGALLLQE